MTPRIITADEARVLREAATPGPWRVTDYDTVAPSIGCGGWDIAVVHGDDDGRPWDADDSEPVAPLPLSDAALIAAAPDLAATVEALEAERDALAEACGLLGERLDRHAVKRAESYEAGRDAEREAVVAFLRREAQAVGRMRGISAAAGATIADALRTAADGIERGEHVAGGEP